MTARKAPHGKRRATNPTTRAPPLFGHFKKSYGSLRVGNNFFRALRTRKLLGSELGRTAGYLDLNTGTARRHARLLRREREQESPFGYGILPGWLLK